MTIVETNELRARPIAATVFAWWTIHGLATVVGVFAEGVAPSLAVRHVADWALVAIGLSVFIGGVTALWSLASTTATVNGLILEAAGLIIAGAGWAAYAITGLTTSIEHVGTALTFAVCAVARLRQIRNSYRLVLAVERFVGGEWVGHGPR